MEGAVSAMTEFLSSCGEVFTAALGWAVEVSETVVSTPVMLVPIAISIACAGIGVFKRLAR